MLLSDLFSETILAITANKTRSSLTILGIVIGIGSVIAMVSIGQGAQKSIESNIQSIGSNLIMVMPGAQRGAGTQVSGGRGNAQSLKLSDAEAIKAINNVNNVSPELSRRYQVIYKGKNTNTSIVGTSEVYPNVRNLQINEGNFLNIQNIESAAKVAVLGPTTRDDLFGEGASNVVGETIRINGMNFKVIGVTVAKGGSGFSNQDDQIFIPITTAQRFLTGNEYVSSIYVQAVDQNSLTQVQSDLTDLLLNLHKIKDPVNADFSTMNQADIVATASQVTGTFTILLGAIAGISLLVGGIGIMNMMLTTVTERTREIGLRKAIGAKRGDISRQFLAESIMLTVLGGIFGILLGMGISALVQKFFSINTAVTSSSIFLAVGVSALIGIVFGYYPASRAAKMNPIEALRYE